MGNQKVKRTTASVQAVIIEPRNSRDAEADVLGTTEGNKIQASDLLEFSAGVGGESRRTEHVHIGLPRNLRGPVVPRA